MRAFGNLLNDRRRQQLGEVVRFGVVGVAATLLQYVIYLVACRWIHPTIANTVGYGLSFLFNYWASTHYTFRVKGSVSKGAGFALSHAINFGLQTVLLMLFLHLGLSRQTALLPVFAICVPVNFLLVRFFLKGKSKAESEADTLPAEPPAALKRLAGQIRRLPSSPSFLLSLLPLILIVVLNGLCVAAYYDRFTQFNDNYRRFYIALFHISGFDPLTYQAVSEWDLAYEVHRHPLLAPFVYPLYLTNLVCSRIFGINCVQFVVAALLIVCAYTTFVLMFRIGRNVFSLALYDAWLLAVLLFSMAYVLVSIMVPDHFSLSMCVLTFTLYVCGMKMKRRQPMTIWESTGLFFLTAGISLNNGIKTFMANFFVNRRRFFRPANLLLAVVAPALLIWWVAKWQHDTFVAPDIAQRKAMKASFESRQDTKAAKIFCDTTSLRDSAAITKAVKQLMDKRAAARKQAEQKKPWVAHTGKPMKDKQFWNWTDITTPRAETAVENLFGEAMQLHQDHLLGDVLYNRPVIVRYKWTANYVVEALLLLLLAAGIVAGWRNRLLWLALSMFAFDMLIHFVAGFGINEIYIMSPHWLFIFPIATACLMARLRGRQLFALRVLVTLLAAWLLIYNTTLIVGYLSQV